MAVQPAVAGIDLPVASRRARIATGSAARVGVLEAIRAATPVAWGAAIDVPLIQPYPGCGWDESAGSVLRIATPGAAMSTVVAP